MLSKSNRNRYTNYNENMMRKALNNELKRVLTPFRKQAKENLMELTMEQTLQQGVAAHKEGNLQDAKRAYQAILQSP